MPEPSASPGASPPVIGEITRINGPIVEARNLAAAGMLEVVETGHLRLIGEVIRLRQGVATIQVYENTSGLRPGEPVYGTGRPLSVKLGPGLLGTIYDGIQRPLQAIVAHSGPLIGRGEKPAPLDSLRLWPFVPSCKVGDPLTAGQPYGSVQETLSIEHRLLLPPGVSGTVVEVASAGEVGIDTVVCRLQTTVGVHDLTLCHWWPVRTPRPTRERLAVSAPLLTGQRVIDTFFPLGKGGAAAIPGGFGTGKTMTQQALAKWAEARLIVYIGCGERGNEMTEVLHEFPQLLDPRSGRSLMERTILIANTSNMPVAAREVSIYTGITLAEYYRDMGYDVAVMADSTSRWAEALRELSGRLEEMPADEGFPAYLPARLASFYERAGSAVTLSGATGSISVIGAVSPPGGDFSEPVTQHTARFVRCFWALDRDLANARHYPAISWLNSYSEYLPEITGWWQNEDPEWEHRRHVLMALLQEEVKLQRIARLVGAEALPEDQRLTLFLADIVKNAFLQQNSFDPVDMYCSPGKQLWMMRLLVQLAERSLQVVRRGGTLADIRGLPCIDAVMRMKSTVANGDAAAMQALTDAVDRDLGHVERRLA
jgi:V/A-type H+-transporting ATPase subunit A